MVNKNNIINDKHVIIVHFFFFLIEKCSFFPPFYRQSSRLCQLSPLFNLLIYKYVNVKIFMAKTTRQVLMNNSRVDNSSIIFSQTLLFHLMASLHEMQFTVAESSVLLGLEICLDFPETTSVNRLFMIPLTRYKLSACTCAGKREKQQFFIVSILMHSTPTWE